MRPPTRARILLAVTLLLTLGSPARAGQLTELVTWHGAKVQEFFGGSAAGGGDLDGDGVLDIVISSPLEPKSTATAFGSVTAISGADHTVLWTRQAPIPGWSYGSRVINWSDFGGAVAIVGDIDGDGRADVLVGMPVTASTNEIDDGYAELLSGTNGTLLWAKMPATSASNGYGSAVSAAGDVDADGFLDFAVGEPYLNWPVVSDGAVHVYSGRYVANGAGPELRLDHQGTEPGSEEVGFSLAPLGDVNSDGFDDIAAGAPAANGCGKVLLFLGNAGANGNMGYWTDITYPGCGAGQPNYRFGQAIAAAAPRNGVGGHRLLVGMPRANSGLATLFDVNSKTVLWDSAPTLAGSMGTGAWYGASLALGYFDEDDYPDPIVMAPRHTQPNGIGSVFVYSGKTFSSTLTIEADQGPLGSVVNVGDVTAHSLACDEFVVCAPSDSFTSPGGGATISKAGAATLYTLCNDAPTFSPASTGVTLNWSGGAPPTDTLLLTNTSTLPVPVSWSLGTTTYDPAGSAWLRIVDAQGQPLTGGVIPLPGAYSELGVALDTAALASYGPGTYHATFHVANDTFVPNTADITVTLNLGGPKLGVLPTSVALSSNSPSKALTISNTGNPLFALSWSSSITYAGGSPAGWLALSPSSGGVPAGGPDAQPSLVATVGALPPGLYAATVRLANVGNPADFVDVPVSLSMGTVDATVTPSVVAFGKAGIAATLQQPAQIQNTSTAPGSFDWSVVAKPTWVTVTPSQGFGLAQGGTTPLTLFAQTAGLPLGLHAGKVDFAIQSSPPLTRSIDVLVEVTAPSFDVAPSSFNAEWTGLGAPFAVQVTLTNDSVAPQPVTWSAQENAGWLSLSSTGGTIQGQGQSVVVPILIDGSGLTAGVHVDNVTFSSAFQSVQVPIALNVLPADVGANPGALSFAQYFSPGKTSSTSANVQVSNTGNPQIAASWVVKNVPAWLSVNPTQAPLGTAATVSVLGPTAMNGGYVTSKIRFENTANPGDFAEVAVDLTVEGPVLGPIAGPIVLDAATSIQKAVPLANVGNPNDILSWIASVPAPGGAWFQVTPPSGFIPAGGQGSLTVSGLVAGLPEAVYPGTLQVSGPSAPPQTAGLQLQVGPGDLDLLAGPADSVSLVSGNDGVVATKSIGLTNVGNIWSAVPWTATIQYAPGEQQTKWVLLTDVAGEPKLTGAVPAADASASEAPIQTLLVGADRTLLAPGMHAATVNFTRDGAAGDNHALQVFLDVPYPDLDGDTPDGAPLDFSIGHVGSVHQKVVTLANVGNQQKPIAWQVTKSATFDKTGAPATNADLQPDLASWLVVPSAGTIAPFEESVDVPITVNERAFLESLVLKPVSASQQDLGPYRVDLTFRRTNDLGGAGPATDEYAVSVFVSAAFNQFLPKNELFGVLVDSQDIDVAEVEILKNTELKLVLKSSPDGFTSANDSAFDITVYPPIGSPYTRHYDGQQAPKFEKLPEGIARIKIEPTSATDPLADWVINTGIQDPSGSLDTKKAKLKLGKELRFSAYAGTPLNLLFLKAAKKNQPLEPTLEIHLETDDGTPVIPPTTLFSYGVLSSTKKVKLFDGAPVPPIILPETTGYRLFLLAAPKKTKVEVNLDKDTVLKDIAVEVD